MEDNWLSINHIEEQEIDIQSKTEEFFGKGRNGFCDYALNSIELMIHGVLYLRDNDKFIDENKNQYNDFKHALRIFSYLHYQRIIYTFKASYNLLLQGYYTESANLMRHVVETFVRLRYIAKEESIDLVNKALFGHRGNKGKKFNVTHKEQFDDIAPGLYRYYRILCDIAHGSMASHILKLNISKEKLNFDTGIVFRPEESTFVINQCSVYLLAHIEFMTWIFPEIKKKMSEGYAIKYHETLSILWSLMKDISGCEQDKKWYEAVQHLVKIQEKEKEAV